MIEGTYSDSSKKIETVTASDVSGFNSSVAVESQTLTVTVGVKTTTYTVEIKAAPLTPEQIATNAVVAVENNGARVQADLDVALDLVNALTDATVKADLTDRIAVLQASIDSTAAGTITGLIEGVALLDNTTSGNTFFTKVKEARDSYENLSPNQRLLVTSETLDKLVTKEKSLVYSSDDFRVALADIDVNYIVLGRDFGLQEYIGIEKSIVIEGNGKTLTLADQSALHDTTSNSAFVVKTTTEVKISDLTIDMTVTHNPAWESGVPMYFGLQINNSTIVTLDNLTLKGGHAGLYVNNSTVTANYITTVNNTLGGIGITSTSTLTTNGANNDHTQPIGKPAIWVEKIDGGDIIGYTKYLQNTTLDGATVPANQTYYAK